MIPLWFWIASFVYLALVAAFICTAIKEDDDARLLGKTLGFFAMVAGGTVAFCLVILGVERFL